MAEQINLSKQVYAKTQYERVIDTSFTQLVDTTTQTTPTSSITIDQFFQYYQELFFQIPKFGDINSFEYLVKTANDYIGNVQTDESIQAFIEEITSLRQENLDLQQQLIDLQLTGSING